MLKLFNLKSAQWGLIFCFVSIFLVGCSTFEHKNSENHLPIPVKESGMILDWGLDVKHQALQMIQSSKQECYLDVYELSDVGILDALINAHRRGVDVRVVVDATEKHSQSVGFPTLMKNEVPVQELRIHRGISHIKMLYVDGHILIGGMNYGSQSWLNNDASVYISHPNPSFRSLFLWDYSRAGDNPQTAPVAEMPLIYDAGIESHIISAIQNARNTVQLEAFDFTDRPVIQALKLANRRGIMIEVLLEPTQAVNRKTALTLRNEGIMVRFYRHYRNEIMHAKIIDVDHGKTFIIGSANFSHQAYTFNHEGDIQLYNVPAFAQSFEQDLSTQISRGTDYPFSKHTSNGRDHGITFNVSTES